LGKFSAPDRAKYSLDRIFNRGYYSPVKWEVEVVDEFTEWYEDLSEKEQDSVAASVGLLEIMGPSLGFPHSSGVRESKFGHMRELRIQHEGRPYRVLYAFDPMRVAVLLLGGDKTGNDRWYEESVPEADSRYESYLQEVKKKR